MTKTKANKFVVNGVITECQKGRFYKVTLDNGYSVLAYLSGKMCQKHITIIPDDRVQVELDAVDLSKGRIVYRLK